MTAELPTTRPPRRASFVASESPPTVRDVAYDRLRRLILDGTIAPGTRIVENEIADLLGVSRTPLREALRQLETEGLVTISARRGAAVASLSASEMHEEFLIRATLEGLAIRLAAPRLSVHLRELEHELAGMERSLKRGQRAEYLKHHRLFHQCVFRATHMPRLERMLRNLLEASERYEQLELAHDVLHADEIAHHRELLDLLRTGDGQRAAAAYEASLLAHAADVIARLAPAQ